MGVLNVYCSLVEQRIHSNVESNLLRAVSLPTYAPFNERISITFNPIHYCNISVPNCDTIHIKIENSYGEKIVFMTGEVLLTLHVRSKIFL